MDGKKIRVHVENIKTAARANIEKQNYSSKTAKPNMEQVNDAMQYIDVNENKTKY
ncbi:MAG: DUF3787 domain-containing protein [Oscillospiraceae bacterium]